MATSEKTQKSAAPSTPAAQPAASHAAVDPDALPSRGAVRGDMLGIKALLAAELDQLSDGQNDENGSDATGADTDDSASLNQFDEDAMAQAADAHAEGEAHDDPEVASDTATEGVEGEAASDAADPDETPKSEEEPPPAATEPEAEKPKNEVLQRRFDELTARAKGAEEQLAAAHERLAAYRARDEGALIPDVLDHVETPEDLVQTTQRYNALLQWAIKHPDGGKLGEKDYAPEDVRELHAQLQSLTTEAIPARRDYLAKRQEADSVAVNFYPWLKDTGKGAGALVQKAIQALPAIRKVPHYRMIVADAFIGQVLRQHGIQMTDPLIKRLADEVQAKAAHQGKPAATRPTGQPQQKAPGKPPAAPSRAGVLPPRLNQRDAATKVASQRLRQGQGTEDDLAASIANKL